MARNVNLFVSDLTATGATPQVARYEVAIMAEWVDVEGVPQTRTEPELFPDILAEMSPAWLKENLTDLVLKAARVKYGIDSE